MAIPEALQDVNPDASPQINRALRILEVGSAFPGWGGTEIHLLNLAEQLKIRGHTVHVSCRPGKFVETEAKRRGLETISATCKKQNSWWPIFRYLSILRKGNYDVVHVHWDNDYRVPATAARLCGVPVVLLSHHSPYPFKKPFNRWLYRNVLYNRLIALSESVRRLLLTQGVSPEKAITIHHGIDPELVRKITVSPEEIRKGWGIEPGIVLVGMVGRIGKEKGVFTFLEAIKLLDGEDITGVFVGDGPKEQEVRERAEELGISERILFAGFRNDVNNVINALDIHVLASIWAEPCAAVVQQAMALSKPVIGTDIGGTPEMIDRDVTGLLVPPGDAAVLAASIRLLASDSKLRQSMGKKGRKRIEDLFSQTRMVDKIEGLYLSEFQAVKSR